MTVEERFVVLFVVGALAVGALVRCTLREGGGRAEAGRGTVSIPVAASQSGP